MRLATVIHLIGTLIRLFAPAFLAPALVSAYYGQWNDVAGFVAGGIVTVAAGVVMRRAGNRSEGDIETLRRVEGMGVVAGTWLLIAALGAIPFAWVGLRPPDALFEAMSGITATGATVLRDLDAVGRGILFWRALLHWLGGLGVIALFVAVLPRLAIGGRDLFFAEAAGPSEEKLTPQLRQTAMALWRVYAALTAAQTVALLAAGLPLFDAVCQSLSTLSAGGFSTHEASVAGYGNAAVEWIVTIFMFVAGANFALWYRAGRGTRRALAQDDEFRVYTGVVLVASLLLMVVLLRDGIPAGEALRYAPFQVLSIMTTSGFASTDFTTWSDQAQIVLLLLMFVGGCAGSAAGGPKVVRHILMARLTLRELKRTLHPRGVLPVKLGGSVVPEHTLRDVQVFMLFYLLTFAVGAALVIAFGADLLTGITASIAALGNIGPGLGAVGPMSTFADLHPASKIVLATLMWIGRLEVLTVVVFFRLEVWQAARWSAS